ncbi:MAG: hypothetical protein ACRD4S_13375 [Candidatus Acidiferrales bacterium]
MIGKPRLTSKRFLASAVMLFAATAILSAHLAAAPNASATVTFRKVFKSSYPEFTEIKISENGAGTFDIRALDDAPSPQAFQVSQPLAQKIFQLAAKLHDFQGANLDIHRRIANLGQKTFVYESGSEKYEVSFNYTLDEAASQLANIFEGLSRQELDLSDLQRTMRYDHLGVNDVVRQIESDYNDKLLPEPDRLLPSLDQVASDNTFVDVARQRARSLAIRIRASH